MRAGGAEAADAARTRFTVEDENGLVYEPLVRRLEVEEAGALRAAVLVEGDLARPAGEPLLRFIARLHFFAGSAAVRFVLTLRNPRRAEHPGGLWDLGNGGSVFLRDASLTLALPPGEGPPSIRCSPEVGAPPGPVGVPLELYQDSSGGDNWQSHNHLNRNHVVPLTFRGYRLRQGGAEQSGLRATPVVALTRGSRTLAVAMEHFWQNFPKAVEATADSLDAATFPAPVGRRPRNPGRRAEDARIHRRLRPRRHSRRTAGVGPGGRPRSAPRRSGIVRPASCPT